VSEARWPSFSSTRATTYPGVDVGTRNAEIPFLPAALSVTANTTATSAFFPVVMNCLTPFSTKQSPSLCARAAIAPASDPTCGSVRQKHPSASPRASGTSRRSFCASVPKPLIGPQTTEFWTLTIVETAPSPAAISSSATASDT
jgi:hypothetical protein